MPSVKGLNEFQKAWVMLVIYDKPDDFPSEFVVRAQLINPGHVVHMQEAAFFPNLEAARAFVAREKPESAMIPRSPEDSPSIVESWF